jgi:hypothetical protein
MNTYRPKHFALVELVGPDIFKERGDRCWELLQPAALMTLDALRDKFGPITVNDWFAGGKYSESGLRQFDTTTGAKYGMHKYGGADDCKFKLVSPIEAFNYILAHPSEFPLLTTMEDATQTVTWLHFDVRNHGREGIWVVNPT